MTEFVLDPSSNERPVLRPARLAELRESVVREARDRSEREGVEVIFDRPRRASDIAILWFKGDRRSVLRAVGGWDPHPGVLLQLAHARPHGSQFELSLYVAAQPHASSSAGD